MSGSSRNFRPSENLQPRQDYWDYVPNNRFASRLSDSVPARRSTNSRGSTRDNWRLFEERLIGGSDYGLASLPAPTLPHSPVRYLLIDDYNPYPSARNTFPDIPSTYNQTSAEEESRLNKEEQTKAINKLRKQLYNPHMSNIVKRLGTKSTSNEANSFLQDDNGKRCAVCLEDFETKQFVMLTPCNHMFHEECIVPWVKSQGKCPVCRFVFSEQNATSQNGNRDLISVIRAFNQAF